MARWSVALFGHEKPKVDGQERRAKPGDIIAARPIEEAGRWTPTEHKEFLIVEIDEFEPEQIAALTEPHWDTNTYFIPSDADLDAYYAEHEKRGTVPDPIELYPSQYHAKRRFHIPLADLEAAGVDVDKMLNKEKEYKVKIKTFSKTEIRDKLNRDYVKPDAGMNPIKPLIVGKVF